MTDRDDVVLETHDTADVPEADALLRGLAAFNEAAVPGSNWQPFVIAARDGAGTFLGGVRGQTHWDWLFVAHLFVAEGHRHAGLGSRLLGAAEERGRARGCRHAWLDTFSFQAPRFYEKLGYRQFARLDDYPEGRARHFFRKDLAP